MARCISTSNIRFGCNKKIVTLSILLVFTLCPGGCGSKDTGSRTITVTDSHYLGKLGDEDISLSEAIWLATGEILLTDLGSNERSLVRGYPGFGRTDRIQMEQGLQISIERREEAVDSILPILYDDGDMIEGNGAILDGSAMEGIPQLGTKEGIIISDSEFGTQAIAPLLVICASRIKVNGLKIRHVPTGSAITVAGAQGTSVCGVEICENEITGIGREYAQAGGGITAAAGVNSQGCVIEDLLIQDNIVTDTGGGITIVAGVGIGEDGNAVGNRMEGITIASNRVERQNSGMAVLAATANIGGSTSENILRDFMVKDNEIIDSLDVGFYFGTSQSVQGNLVSSNVAEGILIKNNSITAPSGNENGNSAFLICNNDIIVKGTSTGDQCRDIVLEGNLVDGYTSGLQITGVLDERCGADSGTDASLFKQVHVRDNVWSNVETGITLCAGQSLVSAANVSNNLLQDIVIERENIEAEKAGVMISAGFAVNTSNIYLGDVIFPGYELPAVVQSNTIQDIDLRDCHISVSSGTGIMITGGMSVDSEDLVTRNKAAGIFLEENVIDSQYGVSIFGGLVSVTSIDDVEKYDGMVTDCGVEDVELLGNTKTEGEAVPESHLDQITAGAAPPDSVQDNHVSGIIVDGVIVP